MDKISFLKKSRLVFDFDDDGRLRSVKGIIDRSSGDMK